jgi:hypothetical protein
VLSHALPVIYTLIDDSNEAYVGIGSALLLHVIESAATPTSLQPHLDMIEQVTSLGTKVCRESEAALSLLIRARTSALRVAGVKKSAHEKRVSVCAEYIDSVGKLVGASKNEGLIFAFVTFGIAPLLTQIIDTKLGKEEASGGGIELCRAGLAVLLPLMRYGGTGKGWATMRLSVSSIVAVALLLNSAWPIAHRHGGKVMAALIVSRRSSEDDAKNAFSLKIRDDAVVVKDAAIWCTNIARDLCGERGREVFDAIYKSEATTASNEE